jgi:hypothetical protein
MHLRGVVCIRICLKKNKIGLFELGLGVCLILGCVDTYCLCTSILLIDLLNNQSCAEAEAAAPPTLMLVVLVQHMQLLIDLLQQLMLQ